MNSTTRPATHPAPQRAILLGDINIDITLPVATYPVPGSDAQAPGSSWQLGGTAANFIRVRYPLEGVTNAMAGNGLLGKSFGNINNILGNTTAQMIAFKRPRERDFHLNSLAHLRRGVAQNIVDVAK